MLLMTNLTGKILSLYFDEFPLSIFPLCLIGSKYSHYNSSFQFPSVQKTLLFQCPLPEGGCTGVAFQKQTKAAAGFNLPMPRYYIPGICFRPAFHSFKKRDNSFRQQGGKHLYR